MEKIKTIKGAQVYPPTPNNVQPECIKVCKVYDWTVLSSNGFQSVTIASGLGNACVAAIDAAIADPNVEVTVQCSVPVTPAPLFRRCGLATTVNECDPLCNATVVRQGVTVQGSSQAAIVKLVQSIPVTLTVLFNGVASPDCPPVTSTVVISENTVLCLPVPLTKENISCRVFDITCDASCIIASGADRVVNVDISLCKDVRVETEVVLEVAAKFCQPRLPITPPTTTCPISVPFPPQCGLGFFPEPNCTCQATVSRSSVGISVLLPGTVVPAVGTATLNASICPNCVLDQSSLTFTFTEDPVYPPTNDGFTFIADPGSFTQPACTFPVPGTATLLTGGTGTITTATGSVIPNATFTLLVNQAAGNCSYACTITSALFAVTATVTTGLDAGLCTGIAVRDCVTLSEF